MNPLSVDIKGLIESVNFVFGTNLFIGKEPISPDDCITIYDTGGPSQSPKFAVDESTIQIRARGRGYLTVWDRLDAIRTILLGIPPQALTGSNLVGIWSNTSIISLGTDNLDRNIFTINFRVIRDLTIDVGHRTLLV